MVKVKLDWLLETKVIAFGGQITNANLRDFVSEKFVETNLTRNGIQDIENGVYDRQKFVAVLPGIGLADCFV
jgi:hypothetical protein